MQICLCCGSDVEHRAPCGAQCAGGGYAGEADVHTPPFKPCPRCGATQSEIIHTIERLDGAERVVFHRYKKDHSRDQQFWVIQERRDGDLWRISWQLSDGDGFDVLGFDRRHESILDIRDAIVTSVATKLRVA